MTNLYFQHMTQEQMNKIDLETAETILNHKKLRKLLKRINSVWKLLKKKEIDSSEQINIFTMS